MSIQLVDLIIFCSTGVTFIWYKRRQDIYNTKPSSGINKNTTVTRSTDITRRGLKVGDIVPVHQRDFKDKDSIRVKYKPWYITPAAFNENQKGWVYVRGYSPIERGGSLLWYRPGLHKLCKDRYEAYFRALLNGVETCVKDSLERSNGKVGKCNVVLDANGVGFSHIPPMSITKKILPLFTNLFSGRLGILLIANMAPAAQIFLKMVIPFLPPLVRQKIHLLPSDTKERLSVLRPLVEEEFIPSWLGGGDRYIFDAVEYYKIGKYKSDFISDEEGIEYVK